MGRILFFPAPTYVCLVSARSDGPDHADGLSATYVSHVQRCIRREGAPEAAPEAVRQAVGGGCQSGWGRLLSVTNAIEPDIWRQWLGAGREPWKGGEGPPPPFHCIPARASHSSHAARGGGTCIWTLVSCHLSVQQTVAATPRGHFKKCRKAINTESAVSWLTCPEDAFEGRDTNRCNDQDLWGTHPLHDPV